MDIRFLKISVTYHRASSPLAVRTQPKVQYQFFIYSSIVQEKTKVKPIIGG